MPDTPEFILDARATLGESPSWDQKTGQLYWVDILQAAIHIFDPLTGQDQAISLEKYGKTVGCVAPRRSGGVVFCLDRTLATLDLKTGAVSTLAEVETGIPTNRFNDGKCDPAGRFLAGTMDNTEQGIAAGSLYSLDKGRTVTRLLDGLLISNGLGWSPDASSLYYIDSGFKHISAFDYDLGSGRLRNHRVALVAAEGQAVPDGMTTDMEGMLWIASWDGAAVTRWDPSNGRLLQKISLPAPRVTSCTFGGPRMQDLYITTARVGLDDKTLAKYPLSGGLFRLKTNTVGMPSFEFAG